MAAATTTIGKTRQLWVCIGGNLHTGPNLTGIEETLALTPACSRSHWQSGCGRSSKTRDLQARDAAAAKRCGDFTPSSARELRWRGNAQLPPKRRAPEGECRG